MEFVTDVTIGQLTVFGSPAEEGGAGKVVLIKAGHFADVDCAVMAHPFPATYTRVTLLAITAYVCQHLSSTN